MSVTLYHATERWNSVSVLCLYIDFVDLNQYRLPFTRLYPPYHRQNSILEHAKTTEKSKIGKIYKNSFNFLVD